MDKERRLKIKNATLGIITAILISAIVTISAPIITSVLLWIDIEIEPDGILIESSNEFVINIINNGPIQGINTSVQVDYSATSSGSSDVFSLIPVNVVDGDCVEGDMQLPDEKSKQRLIVFFDHMSPGILCKFTFQNQGDPTMISITKKTISSEGSLAKIDGNTIMGASYLLLIVLIPSVFALIIVIIMLFYSLRDIIRLLSDKKTK